MILTSVDLPAPFAPTRPCTSPRRSSKSTSRRARTPGNDFWIAWARSATSGLDEAWAEVSGSELDSLTRPRLDALVVRGEAGCVLPRHVERAQFGDRRHFGLVHVAVHGLVRQRHHQRDRCVVGLLEGQEDLRPVPAALLDPL